ncbi:hypothetical protein ASG43_21845 [Aureimonas sp. Leaf454]|uniref:DUF6894 family protein n=1 Tax=Aureimonas sp. Leaf454 TaxID=1736381 RepID=UPI0006F4E65B|nr:hypothetical protein [Aureimonas sp. Leaf454]KQT50200.1 hypothetical protein ASG43_21845 [Aureimonas sp. Leaf454]
MRYYYHLRSSGRFVEDLDGVDLPDLATARHEAELCAREMIAERVRTGERIPADATFEVRDHDGGLVHTLAFSTVVQSLLSPVVPVGMPGPGRLMEEMPAPG